MRDGGRSDNARTGRVRDAGALRRCGRESWVQLERGRIYQNCNPLLGEAAMRKRDSVGESHLQDGLRALLLFSIF